MNDGIPVDITTTCHRDIVPVFGVTLDTVDSGREGQFPTVVTLLNTEFAVA
jgi:hypothetical protein